MSLAAGSLEDIDEWSIPRGFLGQYRRKFNLCRRYNHRPLDELRFSELEDEFPSMNSWTMSHVFDLADINKQGYLEEDTFVVACYLCHKFNARTMPDRLPDNLIPPSKRKIVSPEPLPETSNDSSCPTTFKPYRDLSNELWSIIMSYLSKSTLKATTQASKRFNLIGNRLLYRNFEVILPSASKRANNDPHDRTYNCMPPWTALMRFQSSMKQKYGDADQEVHCLIQQYRFLQQMMQNPVHGQYVRKFIFTMGLDLPEKMLPEFPYWIDGARYKYTNPGNLYRMFGLFKNVTYLDLDMPSLDPSKVSGLGSLFPKAQFVQLLGRISNSLVTSILFGSDKAKLSRLVLDNIFDARFATAAEIEEGKNHPIFAKHKPWGFVNMLGHLTADLHGRCSQLETLYLSKFAAFSQRQTCQDYCLFYTRNEEKVYREWASFIATVQPKRLFLRQQIPDMWPFESNRRRNRSPANVLFQALLLPTLLRGWEGLEYLEVSGIREDDGDLLKANLRGVQVVIDTKLEAFKLLENAAV